MLDLHWVGGERRRRRKKSIVLYVLHCNPLYSWWELPSTFSVLLFICRPLWYLLFQLSLCGSESNKKLAVYVRCLSNMYVYTDCELFTFFFFFFIQGIVTDALVVVVVVVLPNLFWKSGSKSILRKKCASYWIHTFNFRYEL